MPHTEPGNNVADAYLTPREAAKYLSVSISYLAALRGEDAGPPWVRLGRRAVRYRRSAVDDFLASRTTGGR